MDKPETLKLTLFLTRRELSTPESVAAALRMAADQIERNGICPGGVWGGLLLWPKSHTRIGHWVVYPVVTESEKP